MSRDPGADMTRLRGQLNRLVDWLLDEILDRDARPGHLTRPANDPSWEAP